MPVPLILEAEGSETVTYQLQSYNLFEEGCTLDQGFNQLWPMIGVMAHEYTWMNMMTVGLLNAGVCS